MTSEWHYSRDGKDSGPVSSAELRQLAATGKLLRTDLLWKEGMAEWKPAAQFPKLFPDEKPASAIIGDEAGEDRLESFKLDVDHADKKSAKAEAPASVADNLAFLQVDVAAAGRKAISQVKSHARTAGKVAALSAERITITTVKLPQAYGRLGASCYQSGSHAGDFPDLFSRITAIQAGRPENRQSAVANDGPAIEKAKAWARLGLNLAKSQVQGIQAKALFIQLGKVCLQRFGEKAGPSDLITSIESLKSRLAEIDAQAEGKRRKSGGISKLVAYGGGLLFGVIVIGTCTYDLGNDKVIRPLAENLPRDPERREAYEEGWERGAADANKWLEEVRELAEGKPLDEYTKSNPSILARKDSLIDEFQSGLDTNIRTLKALFESAESEDHVRRFALIVEEQHGLHDGFKEVVEAGLEGKETSTATVARKETRTLSRAEAEELTKRETSAIVIRHPTKITDEVAEVLAKFKLGLDLRGVTVLSDRAIEVLAQKEGVLYLSGLNKLSDRAARAISECGTPCLYLDSVSAISQTAADFLAQHPGRLLSFDAITKISAAQARSLAKYKGQLSLDGLSSLTPDVADALAFHEGFLTLNGIVSLSPEAADVIVKHSGGLCMDGLAELSPDAARPFAQHRGFKSFAGLKTLSPDAASWLARSTGELSLNGLATVTPDLAAVLARHKNRLYLKGLRKLSAKAAEQLRKHGNLELSASLDRMITHEPIQGR